MKGHLLTVSANNQTARQRVADRLDDFEQPDGLVLTSIGDEELEAADPLILTFAVAFGTAAATELGKLAVQKIKKDGLRSLVDFIRAGLPSGEMVTLKLNDHTLPLPSTEKDVDKFIDATVPD